MNNFRSTSELKLMAKKQMPGRITTLMVAYLFEIIFSLSLYIMADTVILGTSQDNIILLIIRNIVVVAIALFLGNLVTGSCMLNLHCCCRMDCHLSDLFYGIKNHPDKSVLIQLIIIVIKAICFIPGFLYFNKLTSSSEFINAYNEVLSFYNENQSFSSIMALQMEKLEPYMPQITIATRLIFYGFLLGFLLTIPFVPCFYMIVDFPNYGVVDIIKKSFNIMKHNYFRYLKLIISFIPLLLLGSILYGIGLLYVIPYIRLTKANFYMEIMANQNKNLAQD